MPTYRHPGVYIEEVPSGAKPIEGVATSVAAFVGTARRGRMNEAVLIHSFEEYLGLYGTASSRTDAMELSVGAFYQNGGKDAYVMRVAAGGVRSSVDLLDATSKTVLTVSATSEGEWGGDLYIRVTKLGGATFTLEVGHLEMRRGVEEFQPDETYANLTVNPQDGPDKYALTAVNASKVVQLRLGSATAVNGSLTGAKVPPETNEKYFFSFLDTYTGTSLDLNINVDGSDAKFEFDLTELRAVVKGTAANDDAKAIVDFIKARVLNLDIAYTTGNQFVLTSKMAGVSSSVSVSSGALAKALGLDPGKATPSPGWLPFLPETMRATKLNNGSLTYPTKTDIELAFAKLQKVRDISIVVLPVDDKASYPVFATAAVAHCETTKSRMVILDPPPGAGSASHELHTKNDVDNLQLGTSTYAACYYPWVAVSNPVYHPELNPDASTTVLVAPSAFAAGIWSRTDGTRGVWKAPAGVETSLVGAVDLQYQVEDVEQDQLNPLGINCFRRLPTFGRVVWGARTLATNSNPEWRYIPVRRTAILIEQSVYNGIQWAVFEPNDHRLWSSLRANIGSFMDGLYRAGAFQGEKASDAYFVRCGLGDTMTQGDIDRGQVIAVVGFAPLKPAEFVIVRIQQTLQQ